MEESILPVDPVKPDDEAAPRCPECNTKHIEGKIYCNNCGYPVNGNFDQKSDYKKAMLQMEGELTNALRVTKNARGALYILAGIVLFFGLMITFIGSSGNETLGENVPPQVMYIVVAIAAAMYLGLALWSRKNPFAAFLTASILFSLGTLSNIARGQVTMQTSIAFLMQVGVLFVLISGTVSGHRINNIKRKLNLNN